MVSVTAGEDMISLVNAVLYSRLEKKKESIGGRNEKKSCEIESGSE